METINPLKVKGNRRVAWDIVRRYLLAEAEDKCQSCDAYTNQLYIHHIDGCALNNNRDNLIIVCASCHHQLHRYGRNFRAKLQRLINRVWAVDD